MNTKPIGRAKRNYEDFKKTDEGAAQICPLCLEQGNFAIIVKTYDVECGCCGHKVGNVKNTFMKGKSYE